MRYPSLCLGGYCRLCDLSIGIDKGYHGVLYVSTEVQGLRGSIYLKWRLVCCQWGQRSLQYRRSGSIGARDFAFSVFGVSSDSF